MADATKSHGGNRPHDRGKSEDARGVRSCRASHAGFYVVLTGDTKRTMIYLARPVFLFLV